MPKTIKEVADELGVSKDKVKYQIRKLPNLPGEFTYLENNITYLTKHGELAIKEKLLGKLPSKENKLLGNLPSVGEQNDSAFEKVIDILERELEIKNKQIEDLSSALVSAQKAAATAQALHAGTIQKQLQESESEKEEVEVIEEKPSFWQRVFNKK